MDQRSRAAASTNNTARAEGIVCDICVAMRVARGTRVQAAPFKTTAAAAGKGQRRQILRIAIHSASEARGCFML
jgi:hypothetical protein